MTTLVTWDEPMRLALAEAQAALAGDDVPVGAVVLDESGDGHRHGPQHPRGRGRPDRARRGRRAARPLPPPVVSGGSTGCTLVVTLEPCTMCAGALVLARVDRLVFGAYDDKLGAVGSLWDVVRDRRLNHRPEVVAGVLAADSTALLDDFFARHRLPGRHEAT